MRVQFSKRLEPDGTFSGRSFPNLKVNSPISWKKHCIGCGVRLDALILAVRSLDIGFGDEVIVAGNTYIATVLGITENGATPVFVDCNEYYEIDETLIENAITQRTKAVLVTNLYGQCCNLPVIRQICDRNNIKLIEDCAQSHGAHFGNLKGGAVGDVSCFSFYRQNRWVHLAMAARS